MRTAASSESPDAVVDTVVLRYFLLVDEVDLLVDLLGSPLGTPRIVYDDEDVAGAQHDSRSEMARSIEYQRRASTDPARDVGTREEAARNAERLAQATDLHVSGGLVILDLTEAELELVGQLTSPIERLRFGLRFPLDAGEAACLAIAVRRGLVLVTDDADALRALDNHAPQHPYQRIRRLLRLAVQRGLRTEDRANGIHREMRRLGFWDHEDPFPASGD